MDAERFRAFADACNDACGEACAELAGNLADSAFTAEDVRFEGSPGCETFLIERVSTRGRAEEPVFEFCKTQRLPYDAAVERCLRILKEHFPEVEIPTNTSPATPSPWMTAAKSDGGMAR